MKSKIKVRKDLSADSLITNIHSKFENIVDVRQNPDISLPDTLMSGFAVFSLKVPSLFSFEERIKDDPNLKNIYGIKNIPADTSIRRILDEINPDDLRPVFKSIFHKFQRGKCLEKMTFLGKYYLISEDGTGFFSSTQVHCDNCMQKKSSKTGQTIYYHQMMGASLVHPDCKEVIPFCPEPIMKQDGQTKNDCERNASKRFLKKFRKDFPRLPVIIVQDALGANAPNIKELKKHNCSYIIGVKKDGNKYLFEQIKQEAKKGNVTEIIKEETVKNKTIVHKIHFINQMPLNESNQDVSVNFIEYWETKSDGRKQHFSWITDMEITEDNAWQIMRGARARWKIENETFNTLKNQGYNFEHNYGHGFKNLSTVFACLMMLAFMVDQIQQMTCPLFKAALKAESNCKMYLWEKIRAVYFEFELDSMEHLLKAVAYGVKKERPVILENST